MSFCLFFLFVGMCVCVCVRLCACLKEYAMTLCIFFYSALYFSGQPRIEETESTEVSQPALIFFSLSLFAALKKFNSSLCLSLYASAVHHTPFPHPFRQKHTQLSIYKMALSFPSFRDSYFCMKWRSSAVSSFPKRQKSGVWARLNSGVPWTPCSPPQLVLCGWKLWMPVL